MSVLQNDNGTLRRVDLSALSQVVAVDTENILGGGAGAQTDGQTLVDQLAADDVQIKSDLSDQLSEYHVVPSRNNLRITKTYVTANGITWTWNSDNTFTANNTASGNSTYYLTADAASWTFASGTAKYLPKGRYKLINKGTGAVNSSNVFIGCNFISSGGTTDIFVDTHNNGESPVFEITDANINNAAIVYLRVANGQTVSNVPFYPMIVRENETNHTYEPYYVCMKDGKLDAAANTFLGAHNLLEIPSSVVTMTSENTTFTVNRSGGQVTSIVANATQAGANWPTIQLLTKSQLKAIVTRPMILSGCPAGGSDATYYLVVVDSNETAIREYGNGISLTPSMLGEGASLGLAIQCNRGTIPNNVVFKPMLTLAEDTDKTFAPFAMTNRELTEVVDSTGMSYPVQSVYELSASKYIYKCGKIVNISIDIKSLTAESYPGGQNWTTVGSGFPKPHKNVVQNIPAPFADGKLMQAYLTTAGNLQVRGGSVNTNWYTLQLTYICD